MRLLLTGKNGQLGWELQRTLLPFGDVFAFDSRQLDLSDKAAIARVVREVKPDIIVNAAAYTAVDKAESDRETALAINTEAPAVLAEEAGRLGALLVHYSTDYVFDGRKVGAYQESDAANPLNVYGKTKLDGERAIQASGCRHVIFRTSWVYGLRGKNFLLTMSDLLRKRDEVAVVADQYGAPTWSRMVAEVSAQVLRSEHGENEIFHLASEGACSWYDFADEISLYIKEAGLKAACLKKIDAKDYPVPARRPANSRLSCDLLMRCHGIGLPDWRDSLRLCLEDAQAVGLWK